MFTRHSGLWAIKLPTVEKKAFRKYGTNEHNLFVIIWWWALTVTINWSKIQLLNLFTCWSWTGVTDCPPHDDAPAHQFWLQEFQRIRKISGQIQTYGHSDSTIPLGVGGGEHTSQQCVCVCVWAGACTLFIGIMCVQFCVCVCVHVWAILCACVFAMLCMKMFVNFHVLYACIFARCMFFFKLNCKALWVSESAL